ncbi:hypothetical protein COOONC_06506, partial [Cooperia oncophora]
SEPRSTTTTSTTIATTTTSTNTNTKSPTTSFSSTTSIRTSSQTVSTSKQTNTVTTTASTAAALASALSASSAASASSNSPSSTNTGSSTDTGSSSVTSTAAAPTPTAVPGEREIKRKLWEGRVLLNMHKLKIGHHQPWLWVQKMAKSPVNFPVDNPVTFAYGFANTMPSDLYEVFSVTTSNNLMNTFGYFGVVRFEVLNETAVVYHPEKNISSFRSAVYNDYGYGAIPGTPMSSDSQVLKALTSVANSDKVYENSLIVFCLDKLPRKPDYQQYATLVSKNVKTVFLIDLTSLTRELNFMRTAAPLNEIAAATNGHLIVSDQRNTSQFEDLLKIIYASGPSQSLLFARSMRYMAGTTSLGTLPINENVQVTITATKSVYGK